MTLQLTVRNAATEARTDVVVTASDVELAAALLDALRSAVGAPASAALRVEDRALPDEDDVADCALASGDVVVAGDVVRRTPMPVIDVVVCSGPDAGRRYGLSPGRYVAGRDPTCELPIDDSATSWHHVALDVTATEVAIALLEATNGTVLNGADLQRERIALKALPATLQLGDSTVRIARHQRLDHDPIGGLSPGSAARLDPTRRPIVVEVPSAPTPAVPPRVSIVPAAVPLVAGIALTLVLHQWEFIAFTAMSPLMIIGQAVADRRAVRRQNEAAQRDHAAAHHRAERALAAALDDERAHRHRAAPDLGELCAPAAAHDGAVWRRAPAAPDWLQLRLGLADQPSDIEVRGGDPAIAPGVPLVAPLPMLRTLGVTGTPALRRGLARSLVVQAATLHHPADLRMVVIAPGGAAWWGWVRWLPHVVPDDASCVATVGFDADQISARLTGLRRSTDTRRATLVIVDGAPPDLIDSLPESAAVLWCAPDAAALPATCGAVATLTDAAPTRLRYTSHTTIVGGAVPDLVAIDVATAAARRLGRRASGSPGTSDIPRALRWGDVGTVDPTARWGDASAVITLGIGATGPVRLDLNRDGPHALIAGTTGAGKSELLLTIIAELASRNRPDQLSFLLVDHKGGAALGSCARLPHTTGLVTDLDPVGTRRALQSIGAELRRREQRLAATGVPDFESYQRLQPAPSLARLVIVVDEFAALVGEEPAVVAELVAIAQRGRSLGLHLILATQRPEGLVSADIRANTRIRICLGVTREQDSRDVIDSPAAATISRGTPGRAYLRIGPGDLHLFQAARVTEPLRRPAVTAASVPDIAVGEPPPAPAAAVGAPGTDLDELVRAAREASDRWRCDPPPRPWLPPLPTRVTLSALPHKDREVAWGLTDLPQDGTQPPLLMTTSRGSVTLIAGTTHSGRSSAAIAITVALATARSPEDLHIWGIDAANGLTRLHDLPHCGAVIPASDQERVTSLLDHLVGRTRDRRAGNEVADTGLLVVIDGWEQTLGAGSERVRTEIADQVLQLATDGPAAGVHLAITGGRTLLAGRLASVAGERLALRLTDPADYLVLGVPRRDLPVELPPGRGVRASDRATVQVAAVDQADIDAATRWSRPQHPPAAFASLPPRIGLSELRGTDDAAAPAVTIGIRAIDHAPIRLSRTDLGELFLVAGSRRSGRSTALRLVGEQLTDRPVVVVAHRRSPVADCQPALHLDSDDPDHGLEVINRLIATGRTPHLLVDDIDQLGAEQLLDRVDQLIRDHEPGGAIVAVSATIDSVATAFRGPLSIARQTRQGLLLRPTSPRDGDAVGVDLRRRWYEADPPGRGWLVLGGNPIRIQVAAPDLTAQPSTEFELAAWGARRLE